MRKYIQAHPEQIAFHKEPPVNDSRCPKCTFGILHCICSADVPRSRAADPETSKLAEQHMRESGKLSKQQEHVIHTLNNFPGMTAREYDELGHGYAASFHRRLVELLRKGLVRRGDPRKCRVGGRLSHTWFPIEGKP